MPAETRELTIKLPKLKKVLKSTLAEAYTMSGESIGLQSVDLDIVLHEICLAAGVEPTRAMQKAVKKSKDAATLKAIEDFKNEQSFEIPVVADLDDEDEDEEPEEEDELEDEEEETPASSTTQTLNIGERVYVRAGFDWNGSGVVSNVYATQRTATVRMVTGSRVGQYGTFRFSDITRDNI